MGIEKNDKGAWMPDKQTKWPQMTEEERSKVYESIKEKYAGEYANLKREVEKGKEEFWYAVNSPQYTSEYKLDDPKISGAPISKILSLAINRELAKDTYSEIVDNYALNPSKLFYYSLDYIQNSPENVALRKSNPSGVNIDNIPKDGIIKIEFEDYRWKVKIEDKTRNVLFSAFLFPKE